MTSRKLRSRIVMQIISDSDSSIQSCSSSSSSDFFPTTASSSTPPRKASTALKQSSHSTRRTCQDSPTVVVVQLEEILTCDAPNCNYHTSFKVNLERHKKLKHELKRLKCPNCDFVTNNEGALNRHSCTNDSKVSFKCPLCPWTTTVRFFLTQHVKCRHESAKLREQGISRASEFGKRFKCSKCDFRAVGMREIHNHNYSHETEKKYKCSFPGCDYRSKTASALKEHVKRHDVAYKKEFKCQLCFKVFWTRPQLHRHIPSHTKEKVFSCSKCSFATCYSGSLKGHMRKHAKKSDKVSAKQNAPALLDHEESLRTFSRENSRPDSSLNGSGIILQNEATVPRLVPGGHESPRIIIKPRQNLRDSAVSRKEPKKILEKRYKCDQCDFRAIHRCKIIRHAVVHRNPDDKIYSCSFPGCDFKTNWEDYVKKHYRVMHKYAAPDHMCPVEGCDFQTKWKETLAQHQKKIHVRRKRNHQCPMCRKAFYDSIRLNEHINIHTRETKYKCSLCDYVSTATSNVKSHGRRNHAGQKFEPVKLI